MIVAGMQPLSPASRHEEAQTQKTWNKAGGQDHNYFVLFKRLIVSL